MPLIASPKYSFHLEPTRKPSSTYSQLLKFVPLEEFVPLNSRPSNLVPLIAVQLFFSPLIAGDFISPILTHFLDLFERLAYWISFELFLRFDFGLPTNGGSGGSVNWKGAFGFCINKCDKTIINCTEYMRTRVSRRLAEKTTAVPTFQIYLAVLVDSVDNRSVSDCLESFRILVTYRGVCDICIFWRGAARSLLSKKEQSPVIKKGVLVV